MCRYRQCSGELTATQNFYQIIFLDDTGIVEGGWGDFRQPLLLADGLETIKVEGNVGYAVRAVEATLRQTHLKGHLATFKTTFALVTTTGLGTFMTTGGGTTTAGALTTSNSLSGLRSAGGWFEIIQFHYGLIFKEAF